MVYVQVCNIGFNLHHPIIDHIVYLFLFINHSSVQF